MVHDPAVSTAPQAAVHAILEVVVDQLPGTLHTRLRERPILCCGGGHYCFPLGIRDVIKSFLGAGNIAEDGSGALLLSHLQQGRPRGVCTAGPVVLHDCSKTRLGSGGSHLGSDRKLVTINLFLSFLFTSVADLIGATESN